MNRLMQSSKMTRKGIRIGSATAPKCSRYYLRQKSILLMSIFWQKAINMLLLFFSSILSLSFSWSRFIGRTLFWWVMEFWVLFSDRSLESNCATASSSYKQRNNKDQSDTLLNTNNIVAAQLHTEFQGTGIPSGEINRKHPQKRHIHISPSKILTEDKISGVGTNRWKPVSMHF